MRAHQGDWLVVEPDDIDRAPRRGRIENVRSPVGEPPYRVRWLDTGREALVFPGPDAHVVTQEEMTAANARSAARAAEVQRMVVERRLLRAGR